MKNLIFLLVLSVLAIASLNCGEIKSTATAYNVGNALKSKNSSFFNSVNNNKPSEIQTNKNSIELGNNSRHISSDPSESAPKSASKSSAALSSLCPNKLETDLGIWAKDYQAALKQKSTNPIASAKQFGLLGPQCKKLVQQYLGFGDCKFSDNTVFKPHDIKTICDEIESAF